MTAPTLRRPAHPTATYIARLGSGSRSAQARALETIAQIVSGGRETAGTLPWAALTYATTAAVRTALIDRYAARTVNRHLAALRGVLKECWRLELMPADAYLRAADVACLPDDGIPRGRALPPAELRQLLAQAAGSSTSKRDVALVFVLAFGGLRVREAADMPWSHARDGACVRRELTVRGKRQRVRVVPLPPRAQAALATWSVASPTAGPIFPLSVRGIAYRLAVLARRAGIPHVSPHDLRRTYITALLEAGVDPIMVAQLAGHAKVDTTRLYDRRELEVRRAAVAKLEGLLHD